MAATYGEMKRAAEIAAAKVKPRSHLAYEELVQEAWVAVLSCQDNFDPKWGPFGAFAMRAGMYRCERATWRSVRDHARRVLLELQETLEAREPVEDASIQLDRRAWRRAVRAKVRQILAAETRKVEALRLILRTATAKEIAEERGIGAQQVFNESWELRRALRESPELQRLWRERT